MNAGAALIAGLAATAVMTLFSYLVPTLDLPRLDLIRLTGTVVSPKQKAAFAAGIVIHFVMGVLFALLYVWLWEWGVGAANWRWGLLFGAVHGLTAIFALPLMLKAHPRPPQISLNLMALLGLLTGHMLFGLLIGVIYRALT